MRKFAVILSAALILLLIIPGAAGAANFTMSYSFKIFCNPNARQVALNLAEKQASLAKGEQTELEMFVEGLKRRLMSEVYRQILDDIFSPDGPPEQGEYIAGNLVITVRTDEEGNTEIIVEDTVKGEISIIELSEYMGEGWF